MLRVPGLVALSSLLACGPEDPSAGLPPNGQFALPSPDVPEGEAAADRPAIPALAQLPDTVLVTIAELEPIVRPMATSRTFHQGRASVMS